MNHKAHIILGEVIAKYGVQLAVSNAYCEVYLAGHMVDYPNERKQLVAIKALELPKALLNLNNSLISEDDLYKFIRFNLPCTDTDSVAWGVDAWAAALNISETTRKNIRKQCYPSVPQPLNSGLKPIPVLEKTTSGDVEALRSTPKLQSTAAKGLLLTSAASIAALMIFTVVGQPLLGSLGITEASTPPDDGIDLITTRLTSDFHLASDPLGTMPPPTAHFHHEDLTPSTPIENKDNLSAHHQSTRPKRIETSNVQLIDFKPRPKRENKKVKLTVALLDETIMNEEAQHNAKTPVLKYGPKMEELNAAIEAFLISDN